MAKILVVEDESIVAWDIKEILENWGHTVVDLATSGAKALESANQDRPDLVLMDIRLEGEIDGIAAGDEIYHQLQIPVVYLTAHADEITLARATKTNPFGYIIKPFQSQSLQSTVKIALQRHQVETSARLTQAYLANTLNSISDGVIATDRQGLITFINPIAADLTGWNCADAIGVQIDRVFRLTGTLDSTETQHPSQRSMWLKQPVKSSDRCWLLPENGFQIPISSTATPILTPEDEILGSILIFHENTERLTVEMALSLIWLNNLKDNFSDSIANVNRDMHISADLLKQQINDFNAEIENSAVVRHYQFLHQELSIDLAALQEEWRRQFQLIDILIELQTSDPAIQIQSLNDIMFRKWITTIFKNCEALSERYHLDFSYQITENTPQILLMPFPLLELTIIEMFNNACKYTPPYYQIILEVDIRDKCLRVNVVSFEIEISAQALATMFIPFTANSSEFSRQHGSIGLGLSLVKRLLAYLGGQIEAKSDPNATILTLTMGLN